MLCWIILQEGGWTRRHEWTLNRGTQSPAVLCVRVTVCIGLLMRIKYSGWLNSICLQMGIRSSGSEIPTFQDVKLQSRKLHFPQLRSHCLSNAAFTNLTQRWLFSLVPSLRLSVGTHPNVHLSPNVCENSMETNGARNPRKADVLQRSSHRREAARGQ